MILHNDGLMFWNSPRSLYMTFFLFSRYCSVCLASVFGCLFLLDGLNDHDCVWFLKHLRLLSAFFLAFVALGEVLC